MQSPVTSRWHLQPLLGPDPARILKHLKKLKGCFPNTSSSVHESKVQYLNWCGMTSVECRQTTWMLTCRTRYLWTDPTPHHGFWLQSFQSLRLWPDWIRGQPPLRCQSWDSLTQNTLMLGWFRCPACQYQKFRWCKIQVSLLMTPRKNRWLHGFQHQKNPTNDSWMILTTVLNHPLGIFCSAKTYFRRVEFPLHKPARYPRGLFTRALKHCRVSFTSWWIQLECRALYSHSSMVKVSNLRKFTPIPVQYL